jgi:hypothetical protein
MKVAAPLAWLGLIVAGALVAWFPAAVEAAPGDTLLVRVDSVRGLGLLLPGDTLAFVRAGRTDPTLIPLANIARLEIARGTQSHFWSGAGIGLLAGGAIGWIAGYSQGDDPIDPSCLFCNLFIQTAGEKGAVGAIAGGVVGSVIGGLSGASYRTPLWRPASAQDLRVSLMPGQGSTLRVALVWKPTSSSR